MKVYDDIIYRNAYNRSPSHGVLRANSVVAFEAGRSDAIVVRSSEGNATDAGPYENEVDAAAGSLANSISAIFSSAGSNGSAKRPLVTPNGADGHDPNGLKALLRRIAENLRFTHGSGS